MIHIAAQKKIKTNNNNNKNYRLTTSTRSTINLLVNCYKAKKKIEYLGNKGFNSRLREILIKSFSNVILLFFKHLLNTLQL